MTVIKRSPYKMIVENDAYDLTLSTDVISSGFVEWPVYQVEDRYYLQERFDLVVPKGVDVVKVNLSTYRGIQVAKVTIIDTDTNVVWLENSLSEAPTYPRIGVTQNIVYRLKVDDMTELDYTNGNLRIEWSYNINYDPITVYDYKDDELENE